MIPPVAEVHFDSCHDATAHDTEHPPTGPTFEPGPARDATVTEPAPVRPGTIMVQIRHRRDDPPDSDMIAGMVSSWPESPPINDLKHHTEFGRYLTEVRRGEGAAA